MHAEIRDFNSLDRFVNSFNFPSPKKEEKKCFSIDTFLFSSRRFKFISEFSINSEKKYH